MEIPKRAALRFDSKLQQAAQAHSEDMAAHNKLTHQWSRPAAPAPPACGWQPTLAGWQQHVHALANPSGPDLLARSFQRRRSSDGGNLAERS